jgi:hypothetical protein
MQTHRAAYLPETLTLLALAEIEKQKQAALSSVGDDFDRIEVLEHIETILVQRAGHPVFGPDDEDDLFKRCIAKMKRDAKNVLGVPVMPSRGSTNFDLQDGGRTMRVTLHNVNGPLAAYVARISQYGEVSLANAA